MRYKTFVNWLGDHGAENVSIKLPIWTFIFYCLVYKAQSEEDQ